MKINPESFKGKTLLLIIDKLIIGAILAVAFVLYDQYKDDRARQERIESQEIQLNFERAKMAKEFWPIIMNAENDILVRGYTLRSGMMSKAIESNTGQDVAYKLYKEGLSDNDFIIIGKVGLPDGLVAFLKNANELAKESLSIRLPGGGLNKPDSIVDLAAELNRIDRVRKSLRKVLDESINEQGTEPFALLENQDFLSDNLIALYMIYDSGDSFDAIRQLNSRLKGLRLIGAVNRISFDSKDYNAIGFIEKELDKDYSKLSNIDYASAILEVISKYRNNKIHGNITVSISRLATDTCFLEQKTTVDNYIEKTKHYGLQWDAAELLLMAMQHDVRYNEEGIKNTEKIIHDYLDKFKSALEKANTEDSLNDVANMYESGKIIRVLIDVLGEQKSSDSNQLLIAMNNIKEDKLRYFPSLKRTIENALDRNE